VEREPITRVPPWRHPGAEPLVGGRGGAKNPPEAESFCTILYSVHKFRRPCLLMGACEWCGAGRFAYFRDLRSPLRSRSAPHSALPTHSRSTFCFDRPSFLPAAVLSQRAVLLVAGVIRPSRHVVFPSSSHSRQPWRQNICWIATALYTSVNNCTRIVPYNIYLR